MGVGVIAFLAWNMVELEGENRVGGANATVAVHESVRVDCNGLHMHTDRIGISGENRKQQILRHFYSRCH